jgi:hypothetical protein
MALLLFRDLTALQQREQLKEMRALGDANRIAKTHMSGPLRPVSNEAVEAAFRKTPAPGKKPKKKPGRDLGDAMGDYLDD